MLDIADYLKDVQLPTMPEVARLLINSMQDDEIPLEKIRSAISKDPSLTAKLIRLANSARFGLARKVGSVDDAISMVGLNQVRTLCLAACMSDSFPMSMGINRDEFWKESMACAGYAHWIARTIGADAQQAWLTGFMLRLGELIIAQKEPEKLTSIEKMPHLPGGRWDREMDQTGFTEGHIVGELARQWNFPPEVVRGLQLSAFPMDTKPFCRLGGIIHVAMLLAEFALESSNTAQETVLALPADVLKILQLDQGWMEKNLPDVSTFTDAAG